MMPSYNYVCQNEWCNNEWEVFHGINDLIKTCPQCQQETAKRIISDGGSFVLAGGGWARDSYNGSSNHK
jgi:putative FmdB family regulatory protein